MITKKINGWSVEVKQTIRQTQIDRLLRSYRPSVSYERMVCFLSLTQTAEIAIFTFPGILCLAECFFLAEYLLQESVQPFAKLVFEESEVVDRYLGLSWRSHFDDRGVAFGSCPVDVEQGRGYLQ